MLESKLQLNSDVRKQNSKFKTGHWSKKEVKIQVMNKLASANKQTTEKLETTPKNNRLTLSELLSKDRLVSPVASHSLRRLALA